MSRLIILTLTDEERIALEKGSRHGTSHAFRTRCQMILLKAERLPAAQVAQRLGCCMLAVSGWVRRYRAEGISGLRTKPGRGRRAILDDGADLETGPIWRRGGPPCGATARSSAWPRLNLKRAWARRSAPPRSSAS